MKQSSNVTNLKSSTKSSTNSTVKLLVFAIGKLTLALPVDRVKKVKKYTPIHGSGMSYINLTHIGRQEVTVIDLHQKLFNISHDELISDGGYFILTKPKQISSAEVISPSEESLGIRVAQSPSLIEVSLTDIRALPNSYRYADTLEIASHVTVIPQEDGTSQTIFILDLEHLF